MVPSHHLLPVAAMNSHAREVRVRRAGPAALTMNQVKVSTTGSSSQYLNWQSSGADCDAGWVGDRTVTARPMAWTVPAGWKMNNAAGVWTQ